MNVPIPFASVFDRHGRCTSQSSTTTYYDPSPTHSLSILRPIPPHPLPELFRTQERYVSVAVVVVYIGTVQSNDRGHRIPMVARVSIVDYRGSVVLDTYVRPTHLIEDYRPRETGLQHDDLMNAPHFQDVQLRVSSIIRNKIIVGHSLWNFLSVLGLSHPALDTRDLALFRPLRKKLKSRSVVSLPTLVHLYMGRNVGMEYEDSLELSRASMDLFRCCEQALEKVVLDGGWPCNLPPETFAAYYT
ncbi:putative exonuclease [Lyophyllum shimeji]|uniref:Exonuclease n=1 Tax=Lyophyllum shimeji TaxID=47721 RepID=A0A9P3PJ68_LYOSH|nr:putative exonuclease [Lyophyllum shimeji]